MDEIERWLLACQALIAYYRGVIHQEPLSRRFDVSLPRFPFDPHNASRGFSFSVPSPGQDYPDVVYRLSTALDFLITVKPSTWCISLLGVCTKQLDKETGRYFRTNIYCRNKWLATFHNPKPGHSIAPRDKLPYVGSSITTHADREFLARAQDQLGHVLWSDCPVEAFFDWMTESIEPDTPIGRLCHPAPSN